MNDLETNIQLTPERMGQLLAIDFNKLSKTDQGTVIEVCTRLLRKKILQTASQPQPPSSVL